MKSIKKLVLAGFVLLASVMVLAGCKNDSVPEVPKYTVKFETLHGTAPKELVVESGIKLTEAQLPSLADTDDYIFEYWHEKDTPTQKIEAGYSVTKNVTLVAKWRDRETTASVTFSPSDTKFFYDEKVTVTLSSDTEGATIQYKLNSGDWQDYSKEITVTSDTTITAKATEEGLKDSEETRATYTVRKLTKISITPPTRTVYSEGEKFDSTGMVLTATYDDGEERNVTGTIDSDTSSLTKSAGNKEVTVSYTEGEITKQSSFTVVVFPEGVQVLTNYKSPNHTDDTWTYVAFGEWPQTIKAGDVEVTEDESKKKAMGMFTYYLGSDGNYYVKAAEKAYDTGDAYKYSDGTQAGQNGTSPQWFKVEPIVWRVLTESYNSTGKVLLLAENILTGGIQWDDGKNNYMESTIRKWLNGNSGSGEQSDYSGDAGFLQTAFTEGAQKLIESTKVDNSARSTNPNSNASQWNSGNNPYASETKTTDKIFLLSEQEATTAGYGFVECNEYGEGNTRIRVTTDYAKATGAYQSGTVGYGGWWWLRSPLYNREINARSIDYDGYANFHSIVYDVEMGVVPALSISINGN